MGDIIIIFFNSKYINILFNFLVINLSWWVFFTKKKNHSTKRNFYECGFKSTSDVNIQINFNFSMICVFLILYDIEFTLLVPIFFNFYYSSIFQFYLTLIFIVLIIISLVYDWQMNALNWQY